MSTLKKVTPLSDNPTFVNAFANIVADSNGKVCSVCGLAAMGHGHETVWLGYIKHSWDGVPATNEQLLRAKQLTVEAYSNLPRPCGHHYASYGCKTNCVHVDGHCEHCAY